MELEVFGQNDQTLTLDIEEIDLRQVMDQYLGSTSNEFSTRSFVKLLDAVKNPDLESSSTKGVGGEISLEPFEQLSLVRPRVSTVANLVLCHLRASLVK